MQVCALFVFGRNAMEMRKFGLDFRTRPSKWRQITSIMGQGICVHVCLCVHVHDVCMLGTSLYAYYRIAQNFDGGKV